MTIYTHNLLKLSLFTWLNIKSKPKMNSKLYAILQYFNRVYVGTLAPYAEETQCFQPPFIVYLNCRSRNQNLWIRMEEQFNKWLNSLLKEPHLFAGEKKPLILCCLVCSLWEACLLGLYLIYRFLYLGIEKVGGKKERWNTDSSFGICTKIWIWSWFSIFKPEKYKCLGSDYWVVFITHWNWVLKNLR